ncbi:hypothetical protein Tco_0471681 [Tanacetum coccineum]
MNLRWCFRRCPIFNRFDLGRIHVNSLTVNHVTEKLYRRNPARFEFPFPELSEKDITPKDRKQNQARNGKAVKDKAKSKPKTRKVKVKLTVKTGAVIVEYYWMRSQPI